MSTLPIVFRGQSRRYIATITDEDGNPINPLSVRFKVLSPDGSVVTANLTPDSTGVFSGTSTFDAQGSWIIRFETESPATAKEIEQAVTGDERYS